MNFNRLNHNVKYHVCLFMSLAEQKKNSWFFHLHIASNNLNFEYCDFWNGLKYLTLIILDIARLDILRNSSLIRNNFSGRRTKVFVKISEWSNTWEKANHKRRSIVLCLSARWQSFRKNYKQKWKNFKLFKKVSEPSIQMIFTYHRIND